MKKTLITAADLATLGKVIRIVENMDKTDEDAPDHENWEMVESLRRMEYNLKNGHKYFKKLPKTERQWYDANCEACGWFGSSELCLGGHPIADTGDYSDPICPVCNSNKIN